MSATDPQSHEPAAGEGAAGIGRWIRWFVIGLVVLVVVVAIAVALTNLGGDDDPSGGDEQGMGAATVELVGLA